MYSLRCMMWVAVKKKIGIGFASNSLFDLTSTAVDGDFVEETPNDGMSGIKWQTRLLNRGVLS